MRNDILGVRGVGVRISLLPILGAAFGCSTLPDGFGVEPSEVRARLDTVAIARIGMPFAVDADRSLRGELERALTARLEAAGLVVVASEEWEATWRRAAEDVGGVYDASDGERDGERAEVVRDEVFRALNGRRGVDAVVQLDVVDVDAFDFDRGRVGACGGWRPIYWPGGWSGPSPTSAQVSCLRIGVYDRGRRHLFGLMAPLEATATYGHQTRAVRPSAARLQDRAALLEALELLTAPFAENEARGRRS